MTSCQRCSTLVNDSALFCPNCGANLPGASPTGSAQYAASPLQRNVPAAGRKSMSMVLLLAILPGIFGIWGLGHFYIGQNGRGTTYLIIGLVVNLVGFLITIATMLMGAFLWFVAVWVGCALLAINAYSMARRMGVQ